MASTTPTAPAQVGKGQAVHYVRKDSFHSHAIGCGRLVATELTEQQAAGRKECGPCKRAVQALTAEQPAEQVPTAPVAKEDAAPAESAYDWGRRWEAQSLATNQVIAERAQGILVQAGAAEAADGRPGFHFKVNHLAVTLYARDADGQHSADMLDQFGAFLELRDWYATPGEGAFDGPRLAILPPAGQAEEVVLEGKRRREAAEEAHRDEEAAVNARAREAARCVHADACGFQPLMPEDGGDRPIAWTFRTYVGAGMSRYGVVTVAGQVAPVGLYEYVTTAERAYRQHLTEQAPAARA
jgi:hypothetical protein